MKKSSLHWLMVIAATHGLNAVGNEELSDPTPQKNSHSIESRDNGEPLLPSGMPLLRMPFERGAVVFCGQGNLSREGSSHAAKKSRTAYALDFYSDQELPSIVAAASGTVVDVMTGRRPIQNETEALSQDPRIVEEIGYGWGNFVKIDHGGDFWTLYAHLDSVDVKPGDAVATGQKIGVLGRTGAAGLGDAAAHLHFSLHRGKARERGVASPSLPMHALIAVDLDGQLSFTFVSSLLMPNAQGALDPLKGHFYASENMSEKPVLLGPPDEDLAAVIRANETRYRTKLLDLTAAIARLPREVPAKFAVPGLPAGMRMMFARFPASHRAHLESGVAFLGTKSFRTSLEQKYRGQLVPVTTLLDETIRAVLSECDENAPDALAIKTNVLGLQDSMNKALESRPCIVDFRQ